MKKPKKEKGLRVYEVVWYDAHFNDGNYHSKSIENYTPPWIIRSVGYYAGENKVDFKIAQELHESGKRYGHIMSIPKVTIIKKRRLK